MRRTPFLRCDNSQRSKFMIFCFFEIQANISISYASDTNMHSCRVVWRNINIVQQNISVQQKHWLCVCANRYHIQYIKNSGFQLGKETCVCALHANSIIGPVQLDSNLFGLLFLYCNIDLFNFHVTIFVWISFMKLLQNRLSSTRLWRNVGGELLYRTWHVILIFFILII